MKKIFNLVTRLSLALLLIGAVIFPAKSFAADNPESEGIKAFRQALKSDSDAMDRIFCI